MDSLAAAPGTGPATSPLPILRKPRPPARFEDLPVARTLVMGILNVTPDSFSDGGKHPTADSAIAAGLRMFYAGADIIDVGGESTRPGAEQVSPEEEQRRILPVIQALVKAGALVSVDTTHASTAAAALEAGAAIVNDISGLSLEPEMAELVARTKVPYILTHRRGDASTMDSLAEYHDVAGEVVAELSGVRDKLYAAGVAPEQIIVDPGLGFSKNDEQNWELLQNLDRLDALGHRILVGASRKRFLGTLLTVAGKSAAPEERDHATAAVTSISAFRGAWAVRVHDVGPSLDAVKVASRLAPSRLSSSRSATGLSAN
ncbi:dihydropteroate synthase [Pseudarthrobacter sp. N5]|uniref:dihydropteroate synthase n=1 Tax=Pseudarthrobacter sp. N5 TaxID=3418416 RepID=UPI003CEA1E39